ncbi:MAG: CatB-related O-acetyltransferase [Peptostreptococcus sp.]|uniref:CatB-related O-acetyltransferase n=1 Tax=Peptostreptococcus sp. TaxID=1262 RepID=UPI002FCAC123
MNKNKFNHWSETKYLKSLVSNPLIEVGDYSYYSGYYNNYSFEDGCVRYMWGDSKSRELFNPIEQFGWDLDRLIIGNYVCIAVGVTILMGGNHNHNTDWITVYPFESEIKDSFKSKGNTVIKSDAWLGMNSTIMPGVTIGEGAVVAAGSVVVSDVDAYTVVGGNPAKLIKKRFDDDEIDKLLEMRWFDWDREDILKASKILSSPSIDNLYSYYLENIKNNKK